MEPQHDQKPFGNLKLLCSLFQLKCCLEDMRVVYSQAGFKLMHMFLQVTTCMYVFINVVAFPHVL